MTMTNYHMIMSLHLAASNRADQHLDSHDILALQDIARACLRGHVFTHAIIQHNGIPVWCVKCSALNDMPLKEHYLEQGQYNLQNSVASGHNRK